MENKTVWIIEDEAPARQHLARKLHQVRPGWQVTKTAESNKEFSELLERATFPDLIFCDIELSDGQSLISLAKLEVNIPVVFTTAYGEFTREAFENKGVGYLMKPISIRALDECLSRIFPSSTSEKPSFKSQFLVKKGNVFVPLKIADVVYFNFDTYVFAVDQGGKNYALSHESLSKLEEDLNPRQFFRISRQQIVQKDYIKTVHPYHSGRLLIESTSGLKLTVSRDRVNDFKDWMGR
ncbi:MAG: response regulator transcription factor [Cryomorphaceae bacterium]|nr:response regulator transcription factor [Cryomorphaceae bacterium]